MHQRLSKVQRLIWSISLSSPTLIAYYLPWTFPNTLLKNHNPYSVLPAGRAESTEIYIPKIARYSFVYDGILFNTFYGLIEAICFPSKQGLLFRNRKTWSFPQHIYGMYNKAAGSW